MRKIKIILFATASVSLSVWLLSYYTRDDYRPAISPAGPVEIPAGEGVPVRNEAKDRVSLPTEVDLEVPFISQAPRQQWGPPYKDFCEETSALMAAGFVAKKDFSRPDEANRALLAIQKFELERFGFYEDTNAAETAIILKEYFNLSKVEIVADPSADQIRRFLARGKVVIVPAAGWILGNPYYQDPGPIYHMLVIKGYDRNGNFITNDPGTIRGADYPYAEKVIMEAIHDWNGEAVDMSRKAIIVVG